MNIEDIVVNKKLTIVFMGTPDFSVPVLKALIDNYGVKAVVTQPDKQVGRNGKIAKPPVKILAEQYNILVLQFNKVRESYQEIIVVKENADIVQILDQRKRSRKKKEKNK